MPYYIPHDIVVYEGLVLSGHSSNNSEFPMSWISMSPPALTLKLRKPYACAFRIALLILNWFLLSWTNPSTNVELSKLAAISKSILNSADRFFPTDPHLIYKDGSQLMIYQHGLGRHVSMQLYFVMFTKKKISTWTLSTVQSLAYIWHTSAYFDLFNVSINWRFISSLVEGFVQSPLK